MKATFAAGCFWGIEAEFRTIDGVTETRVGYTGGTIENPTYEQVCHTNSGHAEAVEITFDPEIVSYDELLEVFWSIHNPTTKNRQGWDIGSQYRSAIFFHDEDQHIAALRSLAIAQGNHRRKIVTEILEAPTFWGAEEYHQRYFEKNRGAACNTVLRAKLEASAGS